MSEDTPEVDPIDVMIAQIRAKMDKLQRAIDALEGVRGELGGAAAPVIPANVTTQGRPPAYGSGPLQDWEKDHTIFRAMSIPDATIKLLRLANRPMKNPDITQCLARGGLIMGSADPINTVGAVLTRRWQQQGDIVKAGRGVWALKEWTKGMPRPKPKNGDQEAEEGAGSEPAPQTTADQGA